MPEETTKEKMLSWADKLYCDAKFVRSQLVQLAPQYRQKDEYNQEGLYLENIKVTLRLRRVVLQLAERLK